MKKVMILSMLLLSVTGCDFLFWENNDNNGVTGVSSVPDSKGNIIVMNYSNQRLVLYSGSEPFKTIPSSSQDFLVNVANPEGNVADLWLFKLEDISDNIKEPSLDAVFKRWNVVLSSDTEVEHRVTWLVFGETDEISSGTITFSYVGGTENSVDIFLNNKYGAKITSMRPGQKGKTVGVDFDTYTIYYRYWYSDPQSPDGVNELGWIENDKVNGEIVDIHVILNASRPSRHLQVPHWNGGGAIEQQYGNIEIFNMTSKTIQIWVGDLLIEQVMYTDKPIDNYSTIAANESMVYTMQIGNYTFIAKYPDTATEVKSIVQSIEADTKFVWEIK